MTGFNSFILMVTILILLNSAFKIQIKLTQLTGYYENNESSCNDMEMEFLNQLPYNI